MWLFLKDGFYSVVEKPWDKAAGTLTVRGRRKAHMEKLRASFDDIEIVKTDDADYPYRMAIPRERFATFMADQVRSLDYGNFKDTQKGDEHSIYMNVWTDLLKLEDTPHYTRRWDGDYGFGGGNWRFTDYAQTPNRRGKKKNRKAGTREFVPNMQMVCRCLKKDVPDYLRDVRGLWHSYGCPFRAERVEGRSLEESNRVRLGAFTRSYAGVQNRLDFTTPETIIRHPKKVIHYGGEANQYVYCAPSVAHLNNANVTNQWEDVTCQNCRQQRWRNDAWRDRYATRSGIAT